MSKVRSLTVIFFAAIFWTISANSQGPPASADNLYAIALSASIAEMQRQWGHIDDSYHSGIRTDYNQMLVMKYPEITDELPTQFGGHHVEYVDTPAVIARYKATNKSFSVLEMHPMKVDGDRLTIFIGQSWVEYKKNRLSFAFSDWSEVEFHFDREQNKFTLTSAKLGGI
jgi:hypothetical protein